MNKIAKDKKLLKEIIETIMFYADAETYFGIDYILKDPTSYFKNDFSHTFIGYTPGKKARIILEKLDKIIKR